MRYFLLGIASYAYLIGPSFAQVGTPKTVADLQAEVLSLWPDNTTGQITPFAARQTLLDIIVSYGSLSTSSIFTAPPSVPTASFGSSTLQAASTAFVQANGGGSFLNNLPPFTTPCNPTGITAPAIACAAVTATYPALISGSVLSLAGTFTTTTFFGLNAGNTSVTGVNNTGYGAFSDALLTSGAQNASFGYGTLTQTTSGSNNAAFGFNALTANTVGGTNTAMGSHSLESLTGSFFENTAVGYNSLANLTGANGNTAIGYQCGLGVTTGSNNIFVGNCVASGVTTGSGNAIFGPATGLSSSLTNAIVLTDGVGTVRLDWGKTTASSWTQLRTNFSERFYTTYGTPTIASGACGTGANGVVTSGHNQSGLVTIGAVATTTCTVSFSTTFSTIPDSCVIFPANAAAAADATTVAYVSSISTTQWVITGSALANTAYRYICI